METAICQAAETSLSRKILLAYGFQIYRALSPGGGRAFSHALRAWKEKNSDLQFPKVGEEERKITLMN